VLARLGPKSFLLENERQICCGLLDILFAYVHHELCMQGEESCEARRTANTNKRKRKEKTDMSLFFFF
jgi:hypothetical protein